MMRDQTVAKNTCSRPLAPVGLEETWESESGSMGWPCLKHCVTLAIDLPLTL
jgi:hypothetical protein